MMPRTPLTRASAIVAGWQPARLGGPGAQPARSNTLALAAVSLLAVAAGWIVASHDGFGADTGSAALFALAALGVLAVIMAGPVACLMAIAALTIGGIQPVLAEVGGAEATVVDAFYAGLVGWWLFRLIGRAQRTSVAQRPRIRFGQWAAIAFFVYVNLTFWHVANTDPGALGDSLVSWLRLVLTLSIAFLAASVIESKREVRLVLGAVAVAGVVAVIRAITDADLGGRAGAGLGPNALGMVSGLLLLMATLGAVTKKTRYRIVLAAAGIVGLVLAKSVVAFVATGLAVGVAGAVAGGAVAAGRVTRAALMVALAGVVAFSAVQITRPEMVPGSGEFRGSSAQHRMILGAAGLEIFKRNPVIGVGWRQSSSHAVIGDREIANEVRRTFPDARQSLFPDVRPGSVHNTYIQVLAELGLVGFALLATLIFALAANARRLLRRLGQGSDLWREAWMMSLGLLLVLVWLNHNPLFGGQLETVLAALLVGMLAAISRIGPSRGKRSSP